MSAAAAVGSHRLVARIFVCRVISVRESMAKPLTYLDGSYHNVIPQGARNTNPCTRSD